MNIGDNIRRARQRQGMTQCTLAEKLGTSDRAVSRWETGAASPDIGMLARLALILDTSADALLGMDPRRVQEEVLAATAECTRLLHDEENQAAIRLLREKLAKYPNQPELMVYLARALLTEKTEAAAPGRAAGAGDENPPQQCGLAGRHLANTLEQLRCGVAAEAVRRLLAELPAPD